MPLEQDAQRNNFEGIRLDGSSRVNIGDTFSTNILKEIVAPKPVPKRCFNVLLPRSRYFAGRQMEMAQLSECLESGSRTVLGGLGGVGKSQIALEYCYRFQEKYNDSYVWWIDAADTSKIVEAYTNIARILHLPISCKENLMEEVCDWFSQSDNGRWLFVFDNANEPEAIFNHVAEGQARCMLDYLPHCFSKGQVIVTSTTTSTARHIGGELIEVDILPLLTARSLLRSYLPHPPDSSTLDDLDALAEQLSCIPLALTQAVKYLRQMKKTVQEYLHMLSDFAQKAYLLSRDLGSQHRRYQTQHAIFAVLNLSYSTLKDRHKMSSEILNVACWFHRVNIPERILRQHCRQDYRNLTDVEFDDVILPLMQYSFLEKQVRSKDSNGVFYCMHSLVQAAVQTFQTEESFRMQSKIKALQLLGRETVPLLYKHDWQQLKPWLPHVKSVLEQKSSLSIDHRHIWSPLLLILGIYHHNLLPSRDKAISYLEEALPGLLTGQHVINCVIFLTLCYQSIPDGVTKSLKLLDQTVGHPELLSGGAQDALRFEARLRCTRADLLRQVSPPRIQEAQHELSVAMQLADRFEIVGHRYEQLLPYLIIHSNANIVLAQSNSVSDSKHFIVLLSQVESDIIAFWKKLQAISKPSGVDNNRKSGILWLLGRINLEQASRETPDFVSAKLHDAEVCLRNCYEFRKNESGELSAWTLECLHDWVQCLQAQNNFPKMEELLTTLRSVAENQKQGLKEGKFLECMVVLTRVLDDRGKYREALNVCELYFPTMEEVWGPNHTSTIAVCERMQGLIKVVAIRQPEIDAWSFWL